MAEIRACLEPMLYRSGMSHEGIVIVAPPTSDADPQVTLMAMADSQKRAEHMMETAVKRLQL